jgi:hypothetical protein
MRALALFVNKQEEENWITIKEITPKQQQEHMQVFGSPQEHTGIRNGLQ